MITPARFFALSVAMFLGAHVQAAGADIIPLVSVPSVGCASDGQMGPVAAPRRDTTKVRLDGKIAQDLAYYQADGGPGVLGPRGWFCFGTYGSSGYVLRVSPHILRYEDKLGTGPEIFIDQSLSETSGRFAVATVAARIFPKLNDFVQHVIDEGLVPADQFPRGPYPKDRLTYIHDFTVEYETPAETEGLGSELFYHKSTLATAGAVIFHDDLYWLGIRLPPDKRYLAPAVTRQFEADYSIGQGLPPR